MRYVIVGASGLVGRALTAHFAGLGREFLGTQVSMRLPGLPRFDLRTDRIGDVLPDAFKRGRAAAVICASICQIDRCKRESGASQDVNVDKTIRLIDDLRALGIKPVFVSSGYVFDGTLGYYTEDAERNPICEYGRHKLAVEQYIQARAPEGLILRLDKVVGDDPAQEHLLTEWRRWLDEGKPLTCIAGQVFAPTAAADVATAVERAVESDLSGVYHAANPEFFSREELAAQFALAMGRAPRVDARPMESFGFDDPRPMKTYLDSTKLIKATGMRFCTMRETFASFKTKLAARGARA